MEIIPPLVQTDLGGPGAYAGGELADAFADGVLVRIAAGEQEVGYGSSEFRRLANREQLDAYFQQLNP